MRYRSNSPDRMGPRAGGGSGHEGPVSAEGAAAWLTGRLPDEWFEGPAEVIIDRDEILVIGTLPAPSAAPSDAAPSEAEAEPGAQAEAELGRISRFREETRDGRIRIAREAEHRYGRKVAWGAQCGASRQVFTTVSVPVMTRLRQPERMVLDTLVDSGVARSRSEALAWCVRLVGSNADSWLTELRDAMQAVQRVRDTGPGQPTA